MEITESLNNNIKVIENDYFGMAKDINNMELKMYTLLRKFPSNYFPLEFMIFQLAIDNFRDQTLDYQVNQTSNLIKQSAKMMIECEI